MLRGIPPPRGTEYNRRKLYAIYKKAKSMDKYKKTSLNGDTLITDSVRYNVESLNMLPKDLEPRQFAERTNGNLLIVGGIHSSHQPLSNLYQCDVRHSGHTYSCIDAVQNRALRYFFRAGQVCPKFSNKW